MIINEKKAARHLDIDLDDLDNEILKQSAWFYYWGRKWVKAVRKRNALKVASEESYAERESYWRRKLNKREDHVTESMIKSKVLQDPEYKKVNSDYLDAMYNVDTLKIIKDGLRQKKESIALFLKQIHDEKYSEVKQPKGDKYVLDAIARGVKRKIDERRRKDKRR